MLDRLLDLAAHHPLHRSRVIASRLRGGHQFRQQHLPFPLLGERRHQFAAEGGEVILRPYPDFALNRFRTPRSSSACFSATLAPNLALVAAYRAGVSLVRASMRWVSSRS
jgi:hypothetical protein